MVFQEQKYLIFSSVHQSKSLSQVGVFWHSDLLKVGESTSEVRRVNHDSQVVSMRARNKHVLGSLYNRVT